MSSNYGPLAGAREALAEYDAPRCEATMQRDRPGEMDPRVYRCALPSGHGAFPHDFGPRSTAVSVVHLRAALARVDELEAQLKTLEPLPPLTATEIALAAGRAHREPAHGQFGGMVPSMFPGCYEGPP